MPVLRPPGTNWAERFEMDGYIPTLVYIGPDMRLLGVDVGNMDHPIHWLPR